MALRDWFARERQEAQPPRRPEGDVEAQRIIAGDAVRAVSLIKVIVVSSGTAVKELRELADLVESNKDVADAVLNTRSSNPLKIRVAIDSSPELAIAAVQIPGFLERIRKAEFESEVSALVAPLPPVPVFDMSEETEQRSTVALLGSVALITSVFSNERISPETKNVFGDRLVQILVAAQQHPSLVSEINTRGRRLSESLIDTLLANPDFAAKVEADAPLVFGALCSIGLSGERPASGRDL